MECYLNFNRCYAEPCFITVSSNGEFHPKKHPIMNYVTQNRIAKKRKNKTKNKKKWKQPNKQG